MIKSYIRHKISPGEIHNLSDKESEILISSSMVIVEDPIWLTAVNGTFLGKIAHVDSATIEVEVQQLVDSDYLENEGNALIQSILPLKSMKTAISQSVGIGFTEIIPIQPHYQEIKSDYQLNFKYSKAAKEAQEQSLSKNESIVYDVTTLEEIRMKRFRNHIKICLSLENTQKQMLSDLLKEVDKNRDGRYIIAVGPPKGWHSSELETLDNYGFQMVTLGDAVLRSENAAFAALSAIKFYQGSL